MRKLGAVQCDVGSPTPWAFEVAAVASASVLLLVSGQALGLLHFLPPGAAVVEISWPILGGESDGGAWSAWRMCVTPTAATHGARTYTEAGESMSDSI